MLSIFNNYKNFRAKNKTHQSISEEIYINSISPVKYLPNTVLSFIKSMVVGKFFIRVLFYCFFVAVAQSFELIESFGIKIAIDGATGDPIAIRQQMIFAFVVFLMSWVGATLFWRLGEIVDIGLSPMARAHVQQQLFGYLLGHSPHYFENNFAGRLGQKIKQAGQSITSVIDIVCLEGVRIIVALLVTIILFVEIQSDLALILGFWAILYIGLSIFLSIRCIGLAQNFSASGSVLTGRLIDVIGNADLVRGFAQASFERLELAGYVQREMEASRRIRWFFVHLRNFQAVATFGLMAVVVWIAMERILAGSISVGTFGLVLSLVAQIASVLWSLSNSMLHLFEHVGMLSEALDLVSQPHDITDKPDARALVLSTGSIRFEKLSYSYGDGQPLFCDFDLTIRPGEKIALVGPSGAGKSTLIRLLRRQYMPSSGRVFIDDQDIANVTWDSVNRAVAEVSQQPGVFHRPVRDNIRYGRLDADDEAVIVAAQDAHCHDFIMRRPGGYDTIVGEQGVKLSGGERQRLAIARALLKDARILVLDEATSALDSENEQLIQQALWRLFHGRTVIAVAHRLSTITSMDRIVVLNHGRIMEEGSHAELLSGGGLYARLWAHQAGGFVCAAW